MTSSEQLSQTHHKVGLTHSLNTASLVVVWCGAHLITTEQAVARGFRGVFTNMRVRPGKIPDVIAVVVHKDDVGGLNVRGVMCAAADGLPQVPRRRVCAKL